MMSMREVIGMKRPKKEPDTNEAEKMKQIEEAAYYCYLNRERYHQPGNPHCDWMEGEKEVRGKPAGKTGKVSALTSILKKIVKKKNPGLPKI